MSPSLVSRRGAGTARLALVGAATPDGGRLREALEALRVPGSRVDLYSTSEGDVLLSEYAGEARLIQESRVEEILDHDVIFITERGDLARSLFRETRPAADGGVLIDLVQAAPPEILPPLIHMDINPEAAAGRPALAVPHPLTVALGDLLWPLQHSFELTEAVCLVIRPASDFGESAVEELRQQTVSLLNFSDLPVETLGRQLAFNVVPAGRLACDEARTVESITRETRELMRWDDQRLALRLLTAPMFYGHAIQLRLRFANGVTLADVRRVIDAGEALEPPTGDPPATPAEVANEHTTRLVELSADGLGGFWAWAVAGEISARGAHQALRLADAVCDL